MEYTMQTQLKWLLAAMLASNAFIAFAQDEPRPAVAPATTGPAASADSATNTAMTEQMHKMQAAQDKAAAAKTPAERQAAMQEGMQTMRESMSMLDKQQGAAGCRGMNASSGMGSGMDMPGSRDSMNMHKGMMEMMMKMMDQQASMMEMPMRQ
jgi:hypothetical protein